MDRMGHHVVDEENVQAVYRTARVRHDLENEQRAGGVIDAKSRKKGLEMLSSQIIPAASRKCVCRTVHRQAPSVTVICMVMWRTDMIGE